MSRGVVDYRAWASSYDSTRRASAGVASGVLESLGPPRARLLLDIGGGTGNFAAIVREAGFRVAIVDVAPEMLRRAAAKLGGGAELAAGDAARLPFRSASFDCAICINVLPHVSSHSAALAEARRVLRDGPLVIRTVTSETQRSHWAHAYFPTLAAHQPPSPSEGQLTSDLAQAGFANVRLRRFWYRDDGDGSFQALKYQPEALVEAAKTQGVAVFKRVPRPELERGVTVLERDLRTGRIREVIAEYAAQAAEYGDGVIAVAS